VLDGGGGGGLLQLFENHIVYGRLTKNNFNFLIKEIIIINMIIVYSPQITLAGLRVEKIDAIKKLDAVLIHQLSMCAVIFE